MVLPIHLASNWPYHISKRNEAQYAQKRDELRQIAHFNKHDRTNLPIKIPTGLTNLLCIA